MMSAIKVLVLCTGLWACAGQGLPASTLEPVWGRAVVSPTPGNAGLVLRISDEARTLGTLRALAVVLDGEVVFRDAPEQAGTERSVTLSTTPGRHQLCLVAHYQGGPQAPNDTFLVRAPRLVELVDRSSVSARVRLEEHLGPPSYATASYEGGLPYAGTSTQPDPAKYEARLDELCGNR